jgi:hypothetical protein
MAGFRPTAAAAPMARSCLRVIGMVLVLTVTYSVFADRYDIALQRLRGR